MILETNMLHVLIGFWIYLVIRPYLEWALLTLYARIRNRRYLVIVITTKDGEHEHNQTCTLISDRKRSAKESADDYCSKFWGEGSTKWKQWYEFERGIRSKVSKVREVTRDEFLIIERSI